MGFKYKLPSSSISSNSSSSNESYKAPLCINILYFWLYISFCLLILCLEYSSDELSFDAFSFLSISFSDSFIFILSLFAIFSLFGTWTTILFKHELFFLLFSFLLIFTKFIFWMFLSTLIKFITLLLFLPLFLFFWLTGEFIKFLLLLLWFSFNFISKSSGLMIIELNNFFFIVLNLVLCLKILLLINLFFPP